MKGLGCNLLTSVTFPSSVFSIGFNAFSGCTKADQLGLPLQRHLNRRGCVLRLQRTYQHHHPLQRIQYRLSCVLRLHWDAVY